MLFEKHVLHGFCLGTLPEEIINYAIGIKVENCMMLNTKFMHLDIDFVTAKWQHHCQSVPVVGFVRVSQWKWRFSLGWNLCPVIWDYPFHINLFPFSSNYGSVEEKVKLPLHSPEAKSFAPDDTEANRLVEIYYQKAVLYIWIRMDPDPYWKCGSRYKSRRMEIYQNLRINLVSCL